MRAWRVERPAPIGQSPLRLSDRPDPRPGAGELRARVLACGVCRTDLHLAEGDLAPRRPGAVPGHEVVGVVDELGPGVEGFAPGDLVGIAWLRSTCGACRWCRHGEENLCPRATFTGWDADGGYAQLAVVDHRYAYRLPPDSDPVRTAPLLCAGIIGYRALRVGNVRPGCTVGIYGFGASGHLAAQVCLRWGCRVHVRTRSTEAQALAAGYGVASSAGARESVPEPLDSAILFAPAGDLVPVVLEALGAGGTLAVAGIHLSDIPTLNYQQHLFRERTLRSVTANTRRDGDEFLALAAELQLDVRTTTYRFDEADRALADLAADRVTGAAVIDVASQ